MFARAQGGYLPLTFGILLIGVGLSVTRPYLSLFGTSVVRMTPAELGVFLCVNALGAVAMSTWLGKLSDAKRPKKDILLLSSAAAACGYAVFLWLHSYLPLLVASTVLLGFGSATFPQLFAYAREIASADAGTATVMISGLRSVFSFAWVLGPLLGAWLLAATGYDGLFLCTAVLFAAVFSLVLLTLRRRQTQAHLPTAPVAVLTSLKRPEILGAVIAFVAVYSATSINGLYMPLFLTRTLHAPAHTVGWVFSLSAGLEIPLILSLGRVAERVGKRRLLLAGSACGAVYYAGVAFAVTIWQVLLLQAVCATFIAISVSIGMSYFQDFLPQHPGSATTLYSNTSNLGSMLGSLLGGVIAQGFGFRIVYWCCVALSVVSFLFLLRGPAARTAVGTGDSWDQSAPGSV